MTEVDYFPYNNEVGLCVTDFYTRKILIASPKMAIFTRKSDEDMMGKFCRADFESDQKKRCPFCSWKNLIDWDGNHLGPNIQEMYLESMDIWIKAINQAVALPGGRLVHMTMFYDITESKKLHERLTDLIYQDRLLGIKNDIRLEQDLQKAHVKPSLILFDVLSLRKINECYGRGAGDGLLQAMRDRILSWHVPNSELYRVKGDAFCLAVTEMNHIAAKNLADNLALLFSEPWGFEHEEEKMRISCTASTSVIPGACINPDEPVSGIIERMLERAKKGKRVVIYDENTDKDQRDRIALEWSLEQCIHEDMHGFDVYYQPIVDSTNGIWCGLEALCRWTSPDLGSISPLVFIVEAERLALIEQLGIWVLEMAIRKCKKWGLDECETFILNVNFSAAQFLDKSLAEKIIQTIEKYHYPGKKLCIEITESTNVTFVDESLKTIERLRTHNIMVALDDFGTGYSGFVRLKSIPVDIVKIERVFISDIENNGYHQYLFQAMADLAHTADMKLIAEGVERRSQMNILARSGADYLQGYLFGKPLPPGDLENNLGRFYEQTPSILPNTHFAQEEDIGKAVI